MHKHIRRRSSHRQRRAGGAKGRKQMGTIIRTRRQAAWERLAEDPAPPEVPLPSSSSPPRRSSRHRSSHLGSPAAETSSSATTTTEEAHEEIEEGADKGRAVGILFLAHDGVANPELWERWRESDPAYADRIRFFVFRNRKASHPSPFLQRYDLGLRLRTQWCSASIVKATVESLRRVLLFDPDVAMVYLVSGFDLPIQPPAALFQTRHVVTEGTPRTVVPFRTVLAFTPHEDEGLRAANGWSKKGLDDDVKSRVACHVQWCGLSRAHAEKVVAFPDLPRLLKLGNCFSKHCCPDEWLLGTILALQGVLRESPDVIDWPVTDQYRQKGKDQSPILWGDLDATKARVWWAPPNCFRTFTLGALLDRVSRQEGNLFFRKVGPLTPEETERVLAPVLLHPSSSSAHKEEEEEEKAVTAGLSSSSASGSSTSGDASDTTIPPWDPGCPSSVASDSSSYLEEDVDDEDVGEQKEEEEEEEAPPLSVSSSTATASSTALTLALRPRRGAARGAETKKEKDSPQEKEDDDGDDGVVSVPSTPLKHKRPLAGEEGRKGVMAAARSLRMVGPPGRCAGGRC